MTSPTTDRRYGVSPNLGTKAPVRVAAVAAVTLNGEQTIDGVAVVTGDRVLVTGQADSTANGIYDVDTGDWTRSIDFNGNRDIVNGTLVKVNEGTYASQFWVTSCIDPVTIGTTSIAFAYTGIINGILPTYIAATAGQTAVTVPTYAMGGYMQVTLNGIVQRAGASYDYVETSTTIITFNSAMVVGDVVSVRVI